MDKNFEREGMKRRESRVVGVLSLCIFFIVQSTSIFSAQQEDENFIRGNQLFAAGNYAQACDAYEKIDSKGFAVLYNMGLSYLNQDNYAQAIICSKRAEKQADFAQLTQLYEFLDCMHRHIDPDYVPNWYEQLALFLKKCILSISMLLMQILLLIVILSLMICWYQRWYPMNSKALLCMVFFYLVVVGIWWYKTNMMQQQIGVVTKDLISVFAGPDESFYKKSELHHADEVVVVGFQQEYYQVKAQQVIGWIHNNDIELV